MLRPWVELIDSTRRYGLRIGIRNFRFELGVWIGGFSHCDTYTDEEYAERFLEYRSRFVEKMAKEQALSS